MINVRCCKNENCDAYEKEFDAEEIDGRSFKPFPKTIVCPRCNQNTFHWRRSKIDGFVRTSDQFLQVPRRGKFLDETNDPCLKSYHKDALKRTKLDYEAIASATQ